MKEIKRMTILKTAPSRPCALYFLCAYREDKMGDTESIEDKPKGGWESPDTRSFCSKESAADTGSGGLAVKKVGWLRTVHRDEAAYHSLDSHDLPKEDPRWDQKNYKSEPQAKKDDTVEQSSGVAS
eukprot:gene20247-biopygen6605